MNTAVVLGGVAAAAVYVKWNRFTRCLIPAREVHCSVVLRLVRSSYDVHFRTYLLNRALNGQLRSKPDPEHVAMAYRSYFAAVLDLERNLPICRIFMPQNVYDELLARINNVRLLLAHGEGHPRFELQSQLQLGLESSRVPPAEEPPNPELFEALIKGLEKCTSSSSKLLELDEELMAIMKLLDPEESDHTQDVSVFIPDENNNFPPRRSKSSGLLGNVVKACLALGAVVYMLLRRQGALKA